MQAVQSKGFTLVELLVVISIISILSMIGATLFTGVQKNARDARRRVDIDAIAKALEMNKTADSYVRIDATWFASGAIPFDPKATGVGSPVPPAGGCGNSAGTDGWINGCWYCKKSPADEHNYCETNDGWITADPSLFTNWTICANLENPPGFYCRSNSQ